MCGGGGDAEIKDTPEQKELAKIALERWNRYKEMYLPVEQMYFDYVDSLNTPEAQARAAGTASVNVEGAFAGAIQNDLAAMTSQGTGTDPTSGKFQMAIADRSRQKAQARADNVNQSQQAVSDAHMAGLNSIVAQGNNQSSEAINSMSDVARASAQQAQQDAVSDYYDDASTAHAVGTAAGLGYGAYESGRAI